jgi:hypothetical protein
VSKNLASLQLRREQLVERMAHQRADLSRNLRPVASTLTRIDRAQRSAQSTVSYLRQHPLALVALVGGLALLRPYRVIQLTGKGLVLWRSWRSLQAWVPSPLMQNVVNTLLRRYFS